MSGETKGPASLYTAEIAHEICERLASGETLRSICRDEGMPHESTVRKWAREDREGFSTQYARARDAGLDAIADELLAIADDATNDWMERLGDEGQPLGWQVNGEHVQRSRLRIDTRKWYLSKLAPKRYGEKTEHKITGPDGGPPKLEFVVFDHTSNPDSAEVPTPDEEGKV